VIAAHILMQTEPGKAATVAVALRDLPGVSETASLAGPYDVIARAQAGNIDQLAKLVTSQIQALDGVSRTMSCPGHSAQGPRAWLPHRRRVRHPMSQSATKASQALRRETLRIADSVLSPADGIEGLNTHRTTPSACDTKPRRRPAELNQEPASLHGNTPGSGGRRSQEKQPASDQHVTEGADLVLAGSGLTS
jgi:hypothetical protein